MQACTHLGQIRDVEPSAEGCEECLRMGDPWVHLRECLSCGHVGCCDSSKNKHATRHFRATEHPIVGSFQPGEDWIWCYVDEVVMERRQGIVPTMIVLVNLREGVSPEDYERWVTESYAPAVRELFSVSDWRNHRVTGLLGSDEGPPYRYVVTLEVANLARLGEDMAGERMRALLSELHGYAEVTQLMTERFV